MTIHIEDLTLDVIIGLLDFERDKPQKVILNIETSYEYSDDKFVNYADIVALLEEKLHKERYELLENALLGLKTLLISTYPQLQTLTLKIAKPDILPQCTVALSKSWDF